MVYTLPIMDTLTGRLGSFWFSELIWFSFSLAVNPSWACSTEYFRQPGRLFACLRRTQQPYLLQIDYFHCCSV